MTCEYVIKNESRQQQSVLCKGIAPQAFTIINGGFVLPRVTLCATHKLLLAREHPNWRLLPCNNAT